MFRGVTKAEELPEHEKVYLKKGWEGEWRVVHPHRNEDGTLNLANFLFGGRGNFVRLLITMVIVLSAIYGFWMVHESMMHAVENPCLYCALDFYNSGEETNIHFIDEELFISLIAEVNKTGT